MWVEEQYDFLTRKIKQDGQNDAFRHVTGKERLSCHLNSMFLRHRPFLGGAFASYSPHRKPQFETKASQAPPKSRSRDSVEEHEQVADKSVCNCGVPNQSTPGKSAAKKAAHMVSPPEFTIFRASKVGVHLKTRIDIKVCSDTVS
jgi:hypothetical protein